MSDVPTPQPPPYPPIRRVGGADAGDGHVADLTAIYALGALEPQERARVERHVALCPTCAQALADDQRAAGLLPFLAPPATPGPDVKAALFARIAHAQRAAASARALGRRHLPPTFTIPASTSQVDPAPEGGRQRWSLPRILPARRQRGWTALALPLATMPLLVALVLTGIWGLRMRDQVDDRDDQMAQLQAQISNLGGIVGADNFQLTAASDASEASGRIYVGEDKKAPLLYMEVEEPTASRAYDVYANKGGTLIYAGEVKVDERGVGLATIPLDEPFASYESVQIDAKPLLTDGTDLQEPDTGDGVLAWHQPEEQPSIGETNVEPTP